MQGALFLSALLVQQAGGHLQLFFEFLDLLSLRAFRASEALRSWHLWMQ